MSEDFFSGKGGSKVDSCALLDQEGVTALIGQMVDDGAMVSFGTTRDGGALLVTVTWDGRARKEYFRDAEELIAHLRKAGEAVKAASEATVASTEPARNKRSR